jgi:hypothetical protein
MNHEFLKNMTIDLSAGAGGYDIAEGYINYKLELNKPAFYLSLTPKYFTIEHGKQPRKTTLLNSGNYIGLRLKVTQVTDKTS